MGIESQGDIRSGHSGKESLAAQLLAHLWFFFYAGAGGRKARQDLYVSEASQVVASQMSTGERALSDGGQGLQSRARDPR